MQRFVLASVTCALLVACTGTQDRNTVVTTSETPPAALAAASAPSAPTEPPWRSIVSPEDRERIDRLDGAWRAMLSAVPDRYRALVSREGDLLDPGASRTQPAPSPGSYLCHLVKLGETGQGEPPVKSFPDYVCYIRAESGNRLSFTKQTGTELPGGWFYEDSDRRLVMLGARQRAPGDTSLAYGADAERDLAGTLERIGPFRWRLVLPWRDGKTGIDIYELKPAPVEEQVVEPPPPQQE